MIIEDIHGINYFARVEGAGLPLVALHGFSGSSANWSRDVFPPGYQLIAPDLLGHGQTDSPEAYISYNMVYAAPDLAALIERLTEPPVTLLGYSMGGRLALYLAIRYPHLVSRLILESASPGLVSQAERSARHASDRELADRIERDGIESFVDYWEAQALFATQTRAIKEGLRPVRLAQNPRGLANSLRGMGTGIQLPLWGHLDKLRMPTLLIAGERDSKFTQIAQHMSDVIPDCTLAIIPKAGHTVHLEQPAYYADCLRAFLDE